MIPEIDMGALVARDQSEMAKLDHAVREIGFLTLGNTELTAAEIDTVIGAYREFFLLPMGTKARVDMARTGSNRGWGAPASEQVDPEANPDFKEVFDCGYELPADHPLGALQLSVYAPNRWPDEPVGFRPVIERYQVRAHRVAMDLLRAIASVIGGDEAAFDDAFKTPMALLRGNYYPERPDWATEKDFGIAAHTDYGCLTLLAMDGSPGLEVAMPDGRWQAVAARPGQFVINFGEMLEFWTDGAAKATRHRVKGGSNERISVPLFFNPSHDTNVAPPGSGKVISAGEHLSRRFSETYLHLRETV
ncbi:MAG: isopenicillin N synthase family dioxygenase [Arenibacterium sp.]